MWGLRQKTKKACLLDQAITVIGRGAELKGVLYSGGSVRIDGRLEGEIHTKGALLVGAQAVITGTISAGTLVSGGTINGPVTTSEKVRLIKPALLVGDVRSPAMSVEDGAHFHGVCDTGGSSPEPVRHWQNSSI